jgi:hypothetical protein
MHGRDLVEYRGRIVPRSIVEINYPVPGTCINCSGTGEEVLEDDPERIAFMVPCYRCNRNCVYCKVFVPKGKFHFCCYKCHEALPETKRTHVCGVKPSG